MHLVIDPKIISERPRLFFQILTSGKDPSEVGKTTKWQEADAVSSYLRTFFFAAPRVLILRRWAYVGQQTAEFIVRPDPEVLERRGQSISMVLVCRLNPQTKTLEVVRPGVVYGEPEPEIEQYWEGRLDALNTYSLSRSDEEALAFLDNLPEVGADIDRPLQDWSRYLDWRQKLAEDKANQVYAYTEFEPGRGRLTGMSSGGPHTSEFPKNPALGFRNLNGLSRSLLHLSLTQSPRSMRMKGDISLGAND